MNIFDELFTLQQIDHLIRTRATGSPKGLAKRLTISECSVYRLLERLKVQGFPIAYDKPAQTYYYTEQVKWNVEFVVGKDKILSIKGGEKKYNSFSELSIFDRDDPDFCCAFPTYGV